jgi:hypothetical protein
VAGLLPDFRRGTPSAELDDPHPHRHGGGLHRPRACGNGKFGGRTRAPAPRHRLRLGARKTRHKQASYFKLT